MTIQDKLTHAEQMLIEAKERGDDLDKEYWLGYIYGLRVAMPRKRNTFREDLSDGALE